VRIFSEYWPGKIPGAFRFQLVMSTAAVGTTTAAMVSAIATAVITAIAMVAATRVAAVVSVIPAVAAFADKAVGFATPVAMIAMSVVATSVAVAAVSIIATMFVVAVTSVVTAAVVAMAVISTTVEAAAIVAVVPGAGADEDAADEVVRSIVAIGSAGVRIVAVVTIGADRRRADGAVHGTYSNAHGELCVSISRGKKQNPQKSNVL
jgi:hypothetical protein